MDCVPGVRGIKNAYKVVESEIKRSHTGFSFVVGKKVINKAP